MDVLFVTTGGRTQASSRLRIYELIPYIEQAGISTETIAVPDLKGGFNEVLKKSSFASQVLYGAIRSDIIYLQKVRLPMWFTKILSVVSSTLIYDFDDAIHLAPPGKSIDSLAVRRFNMIIKQSDLTVAGSRDLYKYAEQYTDNVVCLHTGIPRKKYLRTRKLDDFNPKKVLLGWIGNPENLYYLCDIEKQINQILENNDNIRLRIITGRDQPVRPLKHREGKDVEYVEWNLESALADLAEADMGLRPLRDDEWTQAKGGFTSVIECLALGIPVVASPVGILKYLIENEENGYLVDKPEEWTDVLSTVTANPELIKSMRSKSIKTVSKYGFWSENTANELVRILQDRSR